MIYIMINLQARDYQQNQKLGERYGTGSPSQPSDKTYKPLDLGLLASKTVK
jgi:hypothetical protein